MSTLDARHPPIPRIMVLHYRPPKVDDGRPPRTLSPSQFLPSTPYFGFRKYHEDQDRLLDLLIEHIHRWESLRVSDATFGQTLYRILQLSEPLTRLRHLEVFRANNEPGDSAFLENENVDMDIRVDSPDWPPSSSTPAKVKEADCHEKLPSLYSLHVEMVSNCLGSSLL